MNDDDDFQTRIAALLQERKEPFAGMEPSAELLVHLGCRRIISEATAWSLSKTQSTPDSHERFVGEILASLLLAQAIQGGNTDEWEMALLDGLLQRERWRLCLETEAGAYAFALALRKFVWLTSPGFVGESYRVVLSEALGQGVGRLLGDWLLRPELASVPISVAGLTHALFGDVWCDLFLCTPLDANPHKEFMQTQLLIANTRPDFLAGLLPSHLDRAPTPLPGL